MKTFQTYDAAKQAAKPQQLVGCNWKGYYLIPQSFKTIGHARSFGHSPVEQELNVFSNVKENA